jgi:hypothetical protein
VAEGFVHFRWCAAGVHRAGIDGVESDQLIGEMVGQGASDGGERAFARGVGHFAAHRIEVLPGGHKDDPAAGSAVVLRGEGLGQQDGGAGIDSPVRVEHVRVKCVE